ncbi:MAG TPA: AAA family ATPase, partial [Labilithrix sp.]|nr:AAA family ATPase [Labilithrix sp.]
MRHEFDILARLAEGGSVGIVHAIGLTESAGRTSLVLEDAGPVTLKEKRKPLDVGEFLELSCALTKALARVHARGVIHHDINPSNVVLDASGRSPVLIDFDLATTAPENVSSLPDELGESLPYIAPEQTGRMSRVVDQRSDLYSLGVVLYEMLTGGPPFRADDPLGIVHAHLARVPVAASVIAPRVPEQLSRIVDKLLAKTPEQRYQTAIALTADLAECNRCWKKTGVIPSFELGNLDLALRLPLPDRLYGRECELAELTKLLDRVSLGETEVALIAGAGGIGKSALARQLAREVVGRGGRFVEGKFDARTANVPYASLVEALESLIAELRREPSGVRERWRERILDALDPNAGVLTELLPGLVDIIGRQPAPTPLDPFEAPLRLQNVVRAFLDAFTEGGRPVVLFVDDLQWADAATIEVLRALARQSDGRGLFILGAFRPDEVAVNHPVTRLTSELAEAGVPINRIDLKPLGRTDVERLLVDLFSTSDNVRALAAVVEQKTAGNPFFVRQLLRELQKTGLVSFDLDVATWTWDVHRMDQVDITDNVVDLLAKAIDRLPETAQELLEVATCAGKAVDVRMLASVVAIPEDVVRDALEDAVREGLLVVEVRDGALFYRFTHDRVQQAAYARIDEARRRDLHLRIGRYLLGLRPDHAGTQIFDIADQMNLGSALVVDDEARAALAQIDLAAGQKARTTAAYVSALAYLRVGISVLPHDSWATRHDLAFALHREAAECALATGEHALATDLAREALNHARMPSEKGDLYNVLVVSATVRAAWREALSIGGEGLRALGFVEDLPKDLGEGVRVERRAVEGLMAGRSPESLVDAPIIATAGADRILQLHVAMQHPAWFTSSELFAYLTVRSLRFILEHGNGPASLTAFMDWAVCLAAGGELDEAEAFSRLALRLARRFGAHGQEAHALFLQAGVIKPWRHPFAAAIPELRRAYAMAMQSGELRTAAYAQSAILVMGSAAGRELDGLLRDIDTDLSFMSRARNWSMKRFHLAYRQGIRALKGLTSARARFDDDDFEEAAYLASVRDEPVTRCVYEIRRLVTSYLLCDFADAEAHAREASELAGHLWAYLPVAELNFYSSLTFAGLCRGADLESKAALLRRIRRNQEALAGWAKDCPSNFRSKYALVEAELARIEGRSVEATDLYAEAIEAAFVGEMIHEVALARELAGRNALERGRRRFCEVNMREARELYSQWGATEKVRAIEEEFPLLRGAKRPAIGAGDSGLDLHSIVRVAGALSTEVELDRLLDLLLRTCIETAGAERAALVLEEEGSPFVRACGTALETSVLEHTPLHSAAAVPVGLVEEVRRTRKVLVIDDAERDLRTSGLPKVGDLAPKSILLVPIQRKSALVAILCCENSLVTHAFTPARVNVLELLSGQLASALQNGLLVEKLREQVQERTRAERAVRFLSNAGAVLAESLDEHVMCKTLAELVVPGLADWCVIDVDIADGTSRRAASAHVDPEKVALLDTLEARRALELVSSSPSA